MPGNRFGEGLPAAAVLAIDKKYAGANTDNWRGTYQDWPIRRNVDFEGVIRGRFSGLNATMCRLMFAHKTMGYHERR